MNTLPNFFDFILQTISPPEDRLALAKDFPRIVRDHLKDTDQLTTVEPHTRLAGSYSRHTAIGEIKDVDILVFLDPSLAAGKPKEAFDALYSALESLPNSLGVETSPQRRSIRVSFENPDFDLDIVPSVAPGGVSEKLLIPDRQLGEWIDSDPLGYANALSNINLSNGEKIVPLIKLLKAWRDGRMIYMAPKSYWLECMVYSLALSGDFVAEGDSCAVLAHRMFQRLHAKFLPKLEKENAVPWIPDPQLGNNVAAKWERNHFETFMRRLDESQKAAGNALLKECTDEGNQQAAALWTEVFGESWFADTIYEQASAIAAGISGGTIGVTKTGLLASTSRSEASVYGIPKHRFFGDGA